MKINTRRRHFTREAYFKNLRSGFISLKKALLSQCSFLVGEGGFEPPKALPADLQSVPFGHSGIPPYSVAQGGAGGRTRTPDLLITNQLLYRLSYTSIFTGQMIIANPNPFVNKNFQKNGKR